ncbi:MAG: phosphoenolpyruvate--protein phosphotransferase [Deltaproteobacteria bacterium]|nr:phosphoenolpyruvate--protein phosphotransferase [Deltaproteobacteria bacterium]
MDQEKIKKTVLLRGIGVSPGIVSGKAYVLDRRDVKALHYNLYGKDVIEREVERFRKALDESEKELLNIKERLGEGEEIGPLFIDVQIMILRDEKFVGSTVRNIRSRSINAEWALSLSVSRYREMFEKIEDAYLKGRIKDIEDVAQIVFRNLSGDTHESIVDIPDRVILIAHDLSPADTVQMKTEKILAFATDVGSKTSHTAIIARAIEIPATVGLKNVSEVVKTNDIVIIDGTWGTVIVNPDPELIKRYEEKRRHYHIMEEDLNKEAPLPSVTKDGHRIGIGANIEFSDEAVSAVSHGANGVGLFRTEFIYINKEQLPTEEEHYYHYQRVIETEGIKWATIRTFDLGGDKFISDPRLAEEMNPAMGLRAVRYCLREIDLFKVQIRAILRASVLGNTGILIPMISGVEEIRHVKEIIAEVKDELKKEGKPYGEGIKLGIMIEVPSAVVIADLLAREVDFFSIGTNDLIQYSLAIDRVNERVDYLYKPCHPAILRLIKQVVEAGHRAGIKVAMCGEMAGDPLYALVLMGLGLDGLSMTPLAIPRIKKIMRESTYSESTELIQNILGFMEAHEVEEYVRDYMTERFPELCPVNYEGLNERI